MKKLSSSLLLLMGLSVSTAGFASIPAPLYVNGNPSDPTLSSSGGNNGSYTVGNSIGNGVYNPSSLSSLFTAFSDTWNFSIGNNLDLTNTINPINGYTVTRGFGTTTVDIKQGTLGFTLLEQVGATNVWKSLSGISSSNTAQEYDGLSPGNYQFIVTGTVDGTSGKGSYGFNVNVYDALVSPSANVTAVPTPQSWAMLLAGTVLLGFQMRRKSTDSIRLAA